MRDGHGIATSVTAGDVARNFGQWQDQATRGPVIVTHHGRPRVVLLSAEHYAALSEGDPAAGATSGVYEAALAAVLNHSSEGFFALDADLVIVGVNRVFEDFTGLPASRLIGSAWPELFSEAATSITAEHFRRVLRTGETSEFEMIASGRRERTLAVSAFPYSGGVGVLFINRTEERAMAERLRGVAALERALLATDHAAVMEINIRGGLVSATSAFERMTGFEPQQLLRCRLADLLIPRTRAGVLAAVDAVFSGAGAQSVLGVVLGRDGMETPVRLGLSVIDGRQGHGGAKVVVIPQG
jgi:prevent-host-death family protein